MLNLDNAVEMNPALVGGVAVVSVGAAREMILMRLARELELLNGNLRVI